MMSSRPYFASSALSSGTSVRWPAASDDTPTMWTSFSIAWRAASAGRREEGADVDVEAEVGEGGGDHLLAAVVAVLAHLGDEDARAPAVVDLEGLDQARAPAPRPRTCARPPACRRPRSTWISARWRPQTFSSATEISPTVALARAAWTARSSRLPSPVAARWSTSAPSAAATAASSRSALRRSQLVDLERAHARVVDLQDRRSGARRPAGTCSRRRWSAGLQSMRAWARAAASSMRSFGMPASIALAMPPSASTSSMCSQARFARSSVSARRSRSRPRGR